MVPQAINEKVILEGSGSVCPTCVRFSSFSVSACEASVQVEIEVSKNDPLGPAGCLGQRNVGGALGIAKNQDN
jgi:hypothetical protein